LDYTFILIFFMYDAIKWTEIQVGKNHESMTASFISGIMRKQGGTVVGGDPRASRVKGGGDQRADDGWRPACYSTEGRRPVILCLVQCRAAAGEQLGEI
jgi:hypothetical protein